MLDTFIRASLRHRPLVLAVSILLLVLGWRTVVTLPVEVLPDLS